MPILSELDTKIENVLRIMRDRAVAGSEFTAGDFASAFTAEYPEDEKLMEDRREASERAHGLEGYLGGMLQGYASKRQWPSGSGEVD